MFKFKKQSGAVLEVNESSYGKAIELGWTLVDGEAKEPATPEIRQESKKRGRPPKEAN